MARLSTTTWSIISLPVYSKATGMAARAMRRKLFIKVMRGLVCQTSLKKAGRLLNAASLSLKVTGLGRVFFGGRVFKFYFSCLSKYKIIH